MSVYAIGDRVGVAPTDARVAASVEAEAGGRAAKGTVERTDVLGEESYYVRLDSGDLLGVGGEAMYPLQKTPQGLEIPVPSRSDVDAVLRKAARNAK